MRTAVRLGLALAIVASVPFVSAAPASAAVTLEGESSALNSSDKSLTVTCGAGKQVTGGGGNVNADGGASYGYLGIDRLEPLANGTGFVTTIREVDPYEPDWSMSADAVCSDPLPGYVRHSATSGTATSATVTLSATTTACATGKSVVGVGARINSGLGEVIIDDIVPSADLKTVTAKAYRTTGASLSGWSITAYAICANTPAGLELVTWDSGAADSDERDTVSIFCPDSPLADKDAFASGYEIFNGNGSVLPASAHPNSEGTHATAANEIHSGYSGSWNLTIYVICGNS